MKYATQSNKSPSNRHVTVNPEIIVPTILVPTVLASKILLSMNTFFFNRATARWCLVSIRKHTKVSAIIHKRVSYVLCTADAVKYNTQTVRKALKHGIPLVSQVRMYRNIPYPPPQKKKLVPSPEMRPVRPKNLEIAPRRLNLYLYHWNRPPTFENAPGCSFFAEVFLSPRGRRSHNCCLHSKPLLLRCCWLLFVVFDGAVDGNCCCF